MTSADVIASGVGFLRDTAGVYPDASRALWRASGPGAVRALHGLLTNDLVGADPGHVVPCLALNAKGRPLGDVRVWKGEQDLILDLPAAAADSLSAHFAKYIPPRFARVEPLPGAGLVRLAGARAAGALALVLGEGFPLPDVDRFAATGDAARGGLLARRHEAEGGGWDLVGTADGGSELLAGLRSAAVSVGGGEVSPQAFDAWRIERGLPVFGRDFDDASLPQETGLTDRAVSFQKGCYTGQEVVARIHFRGHVNRHLRGLRLPPGGAAEPGAPLFSEGREVGRVTSFARSPTLGPIALGLVRREVAIGSPVALAPDAPTELRVVVLPFTLP